MTKICSLPGCKVEAGRLTCGGCYCVQYCTKEHQKEHWRTHREFCQAMRGSQDGYPSETLERVYENRKASTAFVPPSAKDEEARLRGCGLILPEVRDFVPLVSLRSVIVGEDLFEKAFQALTAGALKNWPEDLWSNVLVAGGAVLACLLPFPREYPHLEAAKFMPWWDFKKLSRMWRRSSGEKPQTFESFARTTRWPTGDVDIFLYGLTKSEAAVKLGQILEVIRRNIKQEDGDHDVVFAKTTNTVTVAGVPGSRRSIQIVTRLYATKASILNSFDLNCCCVGFDGETVWATRRAVDAIRYKLNEVNLDLRGDAYENRALKYAERGFAIGIPRLDRRRLDPKYLAFNLVEDTWGDGMTIDGSDWQRLCESRGLEQLLAVEKVAQRFGGYIPDAAFQGRKKHVYQTPEERPFRMNLLVDAGLSKEASYRDTYPDSDKQGNRIWPATSHVQVFSGGEGSPRDCFTVEWRVGNMPRIPQTWEIWSDNDCCYVGASRNPDKFKSVFDSKAWQRRQEERKKKERDDLEAEIRAQIDRVQDMENECTVCLSARKDIVFEPCRHVAVCQACAEKLDTCPICRQPIAARTKVFT